MHKIYLAPKSKYTNCEQGCQPRVTKNEEQECPPYIVEQNKYLVGFKRLGEF